MKIKIVGTMTGTSCDGLDAACMEISRTKWRLLWTKSALYPEALRKRVLSFQKPGFSFSSQKFLYLHRDLGDWYGRTLKRMILAAKIQPDIVASHGQTIAHFPAKNAKGMTLQLGESTRVAVHTGLTVVSGFREGDMAAGGEGAPLVPLFHQQLAKRLLNSSSGIAIHNLGGISNLTYLGPGGQVIAFDTGPGNIWIDAATQKVSLGTALFDKFGKRALSSQANSQLTAALLKDNFFRRMPPKSTGRDEFPVEAFLSKARSFGVKGNSLISTATEVTVESIARAYENWILGKGLPLYQIYLSGGGAKNLALLTGLRRRLPGIKVDTLDTLGLDPQYVEAQAFAVLGFLSLMGRPVGGEWTGVRGFGPPGQITPGKNWLRVVKKLETGLWKVSL